MQGKAQLPSKVPPNANVRKRRSAGTVERSIQDDGWRWRHLGFTFKYFIMWVCISWFSTAKCKRKYVSVNSSVEACHFFHFLCWHTWVSADGKKALFTLNDYALSLRISHRYKYFWRKRLQNPAGCKSGKNLHRSEEHTSELQSPWKLVCRLLLAKKESPIGYPYGCPAGVPIFRTESHPHNLA